MRKLMAVTAVTVALAFTAGGAFASSCPKVIKETRESAAKMKADDPKVKAVADAVGSYLKNDKYVGNVKAIATTRFQDGGLPILSGKCYMHRQASFYAANWPKGMLERINAAGA